jgi:hypothetical protein
MSKTSPGAELTEIPVSQFLLDLLVGDPDVMDQDRATGTVPVLHRGILVAWPTR